MEIITWSIAALSLIGTIANAYRRRWSFCLWFVTNIAWMFVDLHIGVYAQAALFAVYAVVSVLGYINWGKGWETKYKIARSPEDAALVSYGYDSAEKAQADCLRYDGQPSFGSGYKIYRVRTRIEREVKEVE